eukprot:TRINITY_DN1692_c0_g1_i1.p1 TRINITY_DN1692_c0_g1~~TRINITY_DN1692_c0_g1_i1.p1  ORF type:complete len:3114 (-),score=719.02 TRINITY_DN1692_c0_g1_i1:25-8475(-)
MILNHAEKTETLALDIHLKFLKSSNMEKRMAGLTDLKDVVENFRRSQYEYSRYKTVDPVPVYAWLTNSRFAEWLVRNEVMELLYGDRKHAELMRRCEELPQFLAQLGLLTTSHLDLLWDSAAGMHETIQHVVFRTVASLALTLSREHADHMFTKIAAIPFNAYDKETVTLVTSFTNNAFFRLSQALQYDAYDTAYPSVATAPPPVVTTLPEHCYGISLLWALMQDGSGASEEIAGLAFQGLTDFFTRSAFCFPLRTRYMELCIKNLAEHRSVPRTLRFLQSVITTYPKKKKPLPAIPLHLQSAASLQPAVQQTTDTQGGVVTWLVESHQLLQLLLEDLSNFLFGASLNPAPLTDGDDVPPLLAPAQVDLDALNERLSFLSFVLLANAMMLPENVSLLWDLLVERASSPSLRDLCLAWFENLVTAPQSPLDDPTVAHLFQNCILRLEPLTSTPAVYSLFTQTALFVNSLERRVQHVPDSSSTTNAPAQKMLVDGDFIGIEFLWNLALLSPHAKVGQDASEFLVRLHLDLGPTLQHHLADRAETFVRTCVEHLQLSAAAPGAPAPALSEQTYREIQRSLGLLKAFLQEYERRAQVAAGSVPVIFRRHGTSARGAPLSLRITELNGQNFSLNTHGNELLSVVRQRIAEQLRQPSSLLRLLTAGRELSSDTSTLKELQINDKQQIFVSKRMADPAKDATGASPHAAISVVPLAGVAGGSVASHAPRPAMTTDASPAAIMSRPETFQRLFQMLGAISDRVIAETVWNLLMLLPTNEALLADFRTLQHGNPRWAELLSPRSTYGLLYSLQIIDSLMQESDDFVQGFVAHGGLRHLMEILQTSNFNDVARGAGRKICQSLLLKVIAFFLLEPSTTPNFSADLRVKIFQENSLPPTALDRLFSVTTLCARPLSAEAIDADDIEAVDTGLRIAVAAAVARPEWMDTVLVGMTKFDSSWLRTLLLECANARIRELAASHIVTLCVSVEPPQPGVFHPSHVLLTPLISMLDEVASYPKTCTEYFDLLSRVLEIAKNPLPSAGVVKLLSSVSDKIKRRKCYETHQNPTDSDNVLAGLMTLMCTLLKAYPTHKAAVGSRSSGQLLHEVFFKCLFEIPSPDDITPPKAKHRATRLVAFRLLNELASDPRNFQELSELVSQQHTGGESRTLWHYQPLNFEKCVSGYVGLRNLGATCYMNSLMQQLYMVPAFRYGMLSLDEPTLTKVQTQHNPPEPGTDPQDILADSVLYQFQVIFGHLLESQKKFADTRPFCLAYKDYDGQSVNTSVQMDVDEFFNMLLDKIDTLLKGTDHEKMLQHLLLGGLCSQFCGRGQGCTHVSEKEDPCYALSLDVKGKTDITQSLDLFVEGDMLNGDNKYSCSQCNQKVDALKRSCISALPHTLILHLKRFEFDLELMRRIKVNDRCEFPTELDMFPYTKEGLALKEHQADLAAGRTPTQAMPTLRAPEYYKYKLVGVLVHTGTADSGHYYSFIKERESESGKWLHFNDTLVEEFDVNDLGKCCFGGTETITQWDAISQRNVTRTFQKPYSAYMLFYQRESYAPDAELLAPYLRAKEKKQSVVPRQIFTEIWEENQKFLAEKNVYDPDYFDFMWDFVHTVPLVPVEHTDAHALTPAQFQSLQAIQTGTKFVFETLVHAKEKAKLPDWILWLKSAFGQNPVACQWFLRTCISPPPSASSSSASSWLRQLLFQCTIPETRASIESLLIHVVVTLAPFEYPYPEDDAEPLDQAMLAHDDAQHMSDPEAPSGSRVVAFIQEAMDMLEDAPNHWRNFSQYFMLLRDLAMIGSKERFIMLRRRLLPSLIDFFMGEDAQQQQDAGKHKQKKARVMGDKTNSPDFTHLMGLVSILVRSCHIGQVRNPPPPTQLDPVLSAASAAEVTAVLNDGFLLKVLRQGIYPEAVADVLVHLSWDRPSVLPLILDLIVRGIAEEGEAPAFVTVLSRLLLVADSLQSERCERAISALLNVVEDEAKLLRTRVQAARFLQNLSSENSNVASWLISNKDSWVERLVLGSHADQIRTVVEHLVLALVSDPQPSVASTAAAARQLNQPQQHVSFGPANNSELLNTIRDDANGTYYDVDALSNEALQQSPEIGPQTLTDDRLAAPLQPTPRYVAGVLGPSRPLSEREKLLRRELLDYLYGFMPANSSGFRQVEKDVYGPITLHRYASYFRLLRLMLSGEIHELELWTASWPKFFGVFKELNVARHESDENMREMVSLWWRMMELHPSLAQLYDPIACSAVMDHFISVRTDERGRYYNNQAIPDYYRILMGLAKSNPAWAQLIATHKNFEWAIEHLLFDAHHFSVVPILITLVRELAPELRDVTRSSIVTRLINFERFRYDTINLTKLLNSVILAEPEMRIFCRNGIGSHAISTYILNRGACLDDTPHVTLLIRALAWCGSLPQSDPLASAVFNAKDALAIRLVTALVRGTAQGPQFLGYAHLLQLLWHRDARTREATLKELCSVHSRHALTPMTQVAVDGSDDDLEFQRATQASIAGASVGAQRDRASNYRALVRDLVPVRVTTFRVDPSNASLPAPVEETIAPAVLFYQIVQGVCIETLQAHPSSPHMSKLAVHLALYGALEMTCLETTPLFFPLLNLIQKSPSLSLHLQSAEELGVLVERVLTHTQNLLDYASVAEFLAGAVADNNPMITRSVQENIINYLLPVLMSYCEELERETSSLSGEASPAAPPPALDRLLVAIARTIRAIHTIKPCDSWPDYAESAQQLLDRLMQLLADPHLSGLSIVNTLQLTIPQIATDDDLSDGSPVMRGGPAELVDDGTTPPLSEGENIPTGPPGADEDDDSTDASSVADDTGPN